jgi:hypothetical protein
MAIFGDHKFYVQLALIYSVVIAVIRDRNKEIWGDNCNLLIYSLGNSYQDNHTRSKCISNSDCLCTCPISVFFVSSNHFHAGLSI